MFDWLINAPDAALSSNGAASPLADDDSPATPAPLFALRAFQQAIYGTPKPGTNARKPAGRASKRVLDLPKYQHESKNELANRSPAKPITQLPLPSPSKLPGILLTPGTAANRRKTVTFGSETNRKLEFGVEKLDLPAAPKDTTGRFPTPTQPAIEDEKEARASHNTRSDESKTKNDAWNTEVQAFDNGNSAEVTLDMNAPRSSSGQYWKSEFDSFSSKSSLEMRKLLKKEQLAKKYAKHKDNEALKLADLLRREQLKVAKLEEQVSSYVDQLSLAVKQQSERKPEKYESVKEKTAKHEVSNSDNDSKQAHTRIKTQQQDIKSLQSSLSTYSEENQLLKQENAQLRKTIDSLRRSATAKDMSLTQPDPSSDIWAGAGEDGFSSKKPPRARRPLKDNSRSPLRACSENVINQKALPETHDKKRSVAVEDWKVLARGKLERDSSMTEARREAALKRIEERRKNRHSAGN